MKAEGLRQAREAASLLKDTGDDRRYLAAMLAVNEAALQCGDYLDSIEASQEAQAVLVRLGDKPGQVTVLLGLCGSYFKQEMYLKGVDTANEIISICQEIGDKKQEAQAWFLKAQLKRAKSAEGGLQWPPKKGLKQDDLEEMRKAAQTSVDLFAAVDDAQGEAGARFELCHVHLAKEELDQGQKEIRLSQQKFSQAGDSLGECISLIIGGQVQSAIGEKELATSTMERALELAQDRDPKQPFLERVCKDWIRKLTSKEESKSQTKSLETSGNAGTEEGGITAATYAQCIHRAIMCGDNNGEHFFEHPMQTYGLEAILGARFPFFRNRPPEGTADPLVVIEAWKKPPTKPKVIPPKGAGGGAQQITPTELNLKKPRLPPMALPPEKPTPAASRVQGTDLLGGRLPEVPEDVHSDMVALASKGEIPVTRPEDRAVFITKRPTFYGDPIFRDALRFGYIHPTANQVPRGRKWKSVRAGAFKLIAVAAAA
jgi:hypothetical protein